MNTQEHLAAIRAKCVELLATAKLRTPGTWSRQPDHLWDAIVNKDNHRIASVALNSRSANACFLASCAGPSEAGWAATIAAIDGLEEMDDLSHIYRYISTNIIVAWPEEIL